MERWTLEGTKQGVVERKVDWFSPQRHPVTASLTEPPTPRLRVLHEDSKGMLWVAVSVADPRWKEALSNRGKIQGVTTVTDYEDPNKYFDTILEVIDPQAGRCLARTTLDEQVHDFIDDGSLIIYAVDPDGHPSVTIVRPSIAGGR